MANVDSDKRVFLGRHPNGYKYILIPMGNNSSLKRIICEGGGGVPAELQGAWPADIGMAMRAVKNYLEKVRTRTQRSTAAAAAKKEEKSED